MNKIQAYVVSENRMIAHKTYKMILKGDTGWIDKPGKFINIFVDGFYLRRPISICDYDEKSLTIIYKVVGNGTKALSDIKINSIMNILVDLGNGFDIMDYEKVMIVGGGVGVPPLLGLLKRLNEANKKITAVLGFREEKDVILEKEFKELCDNVYICTDVNSQYENGNVIDVIKKYNLDMPYYACGPKIMLKSLAANLRNNGLISLEERMGCGFGACMGCSHKTKDGYKRVCVEGPVFKSEEIIWED